MLRDIAKTRISDLDVKAPVRVAPGDTVGAAVDRLREARQGALVVEDGGEIVGILTDRDVVSRVAVGSAGWRDGAVRDAMTREPVTVAATASIGEAIRTMSKRTFRHLPVVDGDGRCVGMASIRDIITYIAEMFPEEFINLPPRPRNETHNPWGG